MLAIALAGGFVALAVASLALPPAVRLASWVPVHLLLAGAAATAIAGVMPYFSAAVSGAPPARRLVRLLGVLLVAAGGLLVVAGHAQLLGSGAVSALAANAGGGMYLAGLLAVAAATLLPLRRALGPRRVLMGAIYGAALFNVLIGASLAVLFVAGNGAVVAAWATLKPAHAWLNLFGFLSLVIGGSLLHLLPTVIGARIRRTAASMVAFVALAGGPLLVAIGFVTELGWLASAGALATVLGTAALAWHAAQTVRARTRWTTDAGWHAFTSGSLLAGIGWFAVAVAVAAGQVIGAGGTAAGWRLEPLVVPFALGWAGQVLVGSWTHLVPAIGPGSPAQHATQRKVMGLLGRPRLVLLNLGAVALIAGQAMGVGLLVAAGVALVATGAAGAVVLLAVALLVVRPERSVRRTTMGPAATRP
jgi:nitrite reductase (NO-forming)